MARIIIGAGAGYFLGLYFVALTTSGDTGTAYILNKSAIFNSLAIFSSETNYLNLACVAVGAVMGWAWHSIAVDTSPKDD